MARSQQQAAQGLVVRLQSRRACLTGFHTSRPAWPEARAGSPSGGRPAACLEAGGRGGDLAGGGIHRLAALDGHVQPLVVVGTEGAAAPGLHAHCEGGKGARARRSRCNLAREGLLYDAPSLFNQPWPLQCSVLGWPPHCKWCPSSPFLWNASPPQLTAAQVDADQADGHAAHDGGEHALDDAVGQEGDDEGYQGAQGAGAQHLSKRLFKSIAALRRGKGKHRVARQGALTGAVIDAARWALAAPGCEPLRATGCG